MPQTQTVDAKSVGDFVAKFSRGEIPASIKSQPVPKTQDEPVYNVVADTFDEVIMNDDKRDILIELYASWCGHCECDSVTMNLPGSPGRYRSIVRNCDRLD